MSLLGHELRSPLTQILAYVEALEDDVYGPLQTRQREPLTQIRSGAHRALALVKRVVQIDKIQRGSIPAPTQSCPVLPLCETAFRQAQEIFEFPAKFTWTRRPSAPETRDLILTTPDLFQQMVAEMLGCIAASVTSGRVAFLVGNTADGAAMTLCAMSAASDHPEELDWGAFGDDATTPDSTMRLRSLRPTSFTVVEMLLQLHGGVLTLRDNRHGGVSLAAHLPLAPAVGKATPDQDSSPSAPLAPSSCPPGNKILLADDEPFLLAVMQDHLESSGYEVITCNNGKEALRDAEAHQPDLVIIDVHMPQIGGLEAIRLIRQGPQPLANVPVLCLSGMGSPGDREACLSAGATAYLSKPFSAKDISRIVTELLRGTPQTT